MMTMMMTLIEAMGGLPEDEDEVAEWCARAYLRLLKELRLRADADREVLSELELAQFNSQNELLRAEGEDEISVAEYLRCRLDDLQADLEDAQADLDDAENNLDCASDEIAVLKTELAGRQGTGS